LNEEEDVNNLTPYSEFTCGHVFFDLSTHNLHYDGVSVKQIGWKIKEECPKSFSLSALQTYVSAGFAVWAILDPSESWDFVKSSIGFMGLL